MLINTDGIANSCSNTSADASPTVREARITARVKRNKAHACIILLTVSVAARGTDG